MSNKNKTICALLGVFMLGFGILFAAAGEDIADSYYPAAGGSENGLIGFLKGMFDAIANIAISIGTGAAIPIAIMGGILLAVAMFAKNPPVYPPSQENKNFNVPPNYYNNSTNRFPPPQQNTNYAPNDSAAPPRFEAPYQSVEKGGVYCKSCGAINQNGAVFCTKCGKKL